MRYVIEHDSYWQRIIIRKFRPIWPFERETRFIRPVAADQSEMQMAVWTVDFEQPWTLGL